MLDKITKIVVLLFCSVGLLYFLGSMMAEWEAKQAAEQARKRAAELWGRQVEKQAAETTAKLEKSLAKLKELAERRAGLAKRAVEANRQ